MELTSLTVPRFSLVVDNGSGMRVLVGLVAVRGNVACGYAGEERSVRRKTTYIVSRRTMVLYLLLLWAEVAEIT